ncbi:unnamed protein product, partial [Mycena citricolor]
MFLALGVSYAGWGRLPKGRSGGDLGLTATNYPGSHTRNSARWITMVHSAGLREGKLISIMQAQNLCPYGTHLSCPRALKSLALPAVQSHSEMTEFLFLGFARQRNLGVRTTSNLVLLASCD